MPVGVIESLDHEARGITRLNGKTIFVEGALPGETVEYASFRKKSNFEIAHLVRVIVPSAQRVEPRCPHFGVCGGCAMQHFDAVAQVAAKQRVLEDSLWHIGRVRAESLLPPVQGNPWNYRHRARLSLRKVPNSQGILLGFHERKSNFVADIRSCEVLPPVISKMLMPLRGLFASLTVSDRLPHIEVSLGEHSVALLLRILEPLKKEDERKLCEFADLHGVVFYLQTKGPDSVRLFYPLNAPRLSYVLPEFQLELDFGPGDFTQVNHVVNQVMVRQVMRLMDVKPGERIADMFCGLGNFTLPIARSGARVVGLEGSAGLVAGARQNAAVNGLSDRVLFDVANLFECTEASIQALGAFDKMLIDPPRDGAIELVRSVGANGPGKIVYVSCNPATLARDAAILVNQHAYRLVATGVVNMFPHTAHVESVALFEK